MATEPFPEARPEARRSQTGYNVDKLNEGSSSATQDHKLEEPIDRLVNLLSNGDIGEQRDAAEALTVTYGSVKKNRDRIRDTGATAALVDRLSSPDVHIREHMITLLYWLAEDDEDNGKQLSKSRGDRFRRTTSTASRIHTLLRIGRGQKAYETAAKLLINLSNVDGLKDSLASSGVIEALIDVLRYRKGLKFQKDTNAALASLLRDNGENIPTAAKGGLATILVQLLMHGDPNNIDVDGILALMAVLAAHEGGREKLIRINASPILVKLLKSGKLAAQQDPVATILRALNGSQDSIGMTSSGDQRTDENGMKTSPGENGIERANPDDNGIKANPGKNGIRASPGENGMETSPGENEIERANPDDNGIKANPGKNGIRASPGENGIKTNPNIPHEFRCPISGKLMKDPVTISTGQTYDREFIQQWFDTGNRTCYRTRQPLENLDLKQNILLKFKIAKWREQQENTGPSATEEPAAPHKPTKKGFDIDLQNERPTSLGELARMQSFLDTLSAKEASEADLRIAALGLHDLAFSSPALREEIVVAGAISPLASLLSVDHKASTQDAGIATLLILSLNEENKRRMAHPLADAVPAVVRLLRHGGEDSREKAASTLFSLSIFDENKVAIGATGAIPALVDILSGKDPLSKKAQKDAATCLLTLSIYQGNKAQAVRAGVVPHLVVLLDDDRTMLDLVLAMLAVLSSHAEGRQAIEDANLLPKLVDIMRSGSDRNISNALMIFSTLVMKNPALVPEIERLGAEQIVLELCQISGPGKIQTKALRLLEFLDRHHS